MAQSTAGLAPTASTPGGGSSGGAPADAEYIVAAADGTLTAERVATDTATVAWDFGTAAQAKANVPDDAITYAKIQNVTDARLLGRSAGSAGDTQEITVGSGLSLAAGALTATGGAPTDAVYVVGAAHAGLSAERVVTDTATVAWDQGTAAQMKANVPDNSVTDGKLRDSAALTVIGRSANSSGDPADIAASAASAAVLRESGSTIGFGTLATAALADAIVTYAKMQNVTDARLLGRSSGSSGPPIEITVGSGLALAAGALTATGGGGGITSVALQAIAAGTTTYTPTSGMVFALVFCQGGGGGAPAETAADAAVGGGGGGGCAVRLYTAAEIGASEACVVGATSTGAGNDSTFSAGGTLITGSGGAVGVSTGLTTTVGTRGAGGAGGAATGGTINMPGGNGTVGTVFSGTNGQGGDGGASFLGHGGAGGVAPSSGAAQGAAGKAYGGGAGGGACSDGTDLSAVSGAAGVIWVIEFIA